MDGHGTKQRDRTPYPVPEAITSTVPDGWTWDEAMDRGDRLAYHMPYIKIQKYLIQNIFENISRQLDRNRQTGLQGQAWKGWLCY
ncbi:hypothetical protein AVEN_185988-1 [Araneus ventricosus]|uniref:Uncharacterized protein n=1 Tax=Araneus ventricosus TaxID=182803 RepID=A0A4Y2K8D7_ARAVE|nr:hypothetical protein AVEN_185988-1 [Araneus ventricosus]